MCVYIYIFLLIRYHEKIFYTNKTLLYFYFLVFVFNKNFHWITNSLKGSPSLSLWVEESIGLIYYFHFSLNQKTYNQTYPIHGIPFNFIGKNVRPTANKGGKLVISKTS